MILLKFWISFFCLNLFVHASDFLLIGDSMAEAVAKPLERRFSKTSDNYAYFFKRGTTVNYWISNPELYSYLQHQHPDYILISLGTNDIVAKKTNKQIIDDLNTLMGNIMQNTVKPIKFIIIAPPIPNDNNLNEELQTASQSIYIFHSKSRLLELKADQIHPTPASNERWSDELFQTISALPTVSH